MTRTATSNASDTDVVSSPPGRVKIAEALRSLLREKDFSAITWAEIAETAGVNEALIYKYFGSKRGLLHQILSEYLEKANKRLELDLKGIEGSLNKLRKLIWSSIDGYSRDKVSARILLLEVRNSNGYWESSTYQIVKKYTNMILEILQNGINNGEIREDVSPRHMMQVILGSIEHLILPGIVFGREVDADLLTDEVCKIVFSGIEKRE
jgi:AcrR family transcriptional regulator